MQAYRKTNSERQEEYGQGNEVLKKLIENLSGKNMPYIGK